MNKRHFFRILNFLFYISLLFFIDLYDEKIDFRLKITFIIYVFFNLVCSLLNRRIFFSFPVMIIRLTGFVRYFLNFYIMSKYKVDLYLSDYSIYIINIEMIAHYFVIYFFSIFHRRYRYRNYNLYYRYINSIPEIKISLVFRTILFFVVIYIFFNMDIIKQYFTLSLNKTYFKYNNNFEYLLIKNIIIIIYILCIYYIENSKVHNILKFLISICITIFLINGIAISDEDISRWSIIIIIFILYKYMCKFNKGNEYKISIIFLFISIISIFFGTIIKFYFWSYSKRSLFETIGYIFKYGALNAYFSGFENVEVSVIMKNIVEKQNISKVSMIISDVFGNLPYLNKIITSNILKSVYWFNYTFYGSTIATDQIIPLSGQLFNYFGWLFFIPESFIIYISMRTNLVLETEDNLIKVFYLSYVTFIFSLVNCINISIIFQSLWINILPIFLLYKLNRFFLEYESRIFIKSGF